MHRLLSLYNAFYIYAFPSDHLILDNKLIVLFFSGEDYYSCFQHSLKACCFCIRWRPYWLSPSTLTSLLLSLSMSCLCSHVAEALWVWHLVIWTQSVNAFLWIWFLSFVYGSYLFPKCICNHGVYYPVSWVTVIHTMRRLMQKGHYKFNISQYYKESFK